jgi:hypothetical protein
VRTAAALIALALSGVERFTLTGVEGLALCRVSRFSLSGVGGLGAFGLHGGLLLRAVIRAALRTWTAVLRPWPALVTAAVSLIAARLRRGLPSLRAVDRVNDG